MKLGAIKRLALISGAVTLGVASLFAAAGAQAQTGKGPSAPGGNDPVIAHFVKEAGPAAIRNQNALSDLRAWLMAQPGFAHSGYVGSIDNLAHRAMTVMWYGPRTPLLTALIREGARRGIAVGVQHRKYSLQRLRAASAAIWKQAADGQWAGFRVSAIAAVSAKDTGLTVEGTYTSVPAARRAPQVRSLATVVDGVPVRVAPGHRVVPATLHVTPPATVARALAGHVVPGHPGTRFVNGSRDSDYAPFSGGGFMIGYYTGVGCSSGFSILINGNSHTMTARHCDDKNAQGDFVDADYASGAHPPPTSRWYGKYLGFSGDGAAMIMGNTGFYSMFNRGYTSTTTLNDIGFQDLGVGDLVCTEGGNSGEHCNVKVTNLLVDINDGYGTVATIQAHQQTSGAIAVMEGDSGGPVMALYSVGKGQVRAAGMIQAGSSSPSSCPAAFLPAPCFQYVYFTSMRTVVDSISGASLSTG
jgi:hypothetical protein